jgi:hypothetical protein
MCYAGDFVHWQSSTYASNGNLDDFYHELMKYYHPFYCIFEQFMSS